MGDHDAAGRMQWRDLPEPIGDIFIGQAMKAVATHALVVKSAGQTEDVIDERMRAVEGGIETRNLAHMRPSLARRQDARNVVRLMQRREGHQHSSRRSTSSVTRSGES